MGMNFWMRDTLWVNRFALPRNGSVMTAPTFLDRTACVWSWGFIACWFGNNFFDELFFGRPLPVAVWRGSDHFQKSPVAVALEVKYYL
jgi:hypothetical protein